MKLYHGSNISIDSIDLTKGKKGKDFGAGFYLSDDKEQAFEMAKTTVFRTGKGEPIITEFWFDDTLLKGNTSLSIKVFEGYTEEWAEFILKNRSNKSDVRIHNYDIVIGPIADDAVGVQIRRYIQGYISVSQLAKELTYIHPTIQYFFGTDEAIKSLKRI